MKTATLILAACAALPLAAQAPTTETPKQQKMTPPPPTKPQPWRFPSAATKVLPNGLTVYVIEDKRLPLVSYVFESLAGGVNVPPEKTGLAGMVAGLLREGTATRSSQDISKLVDEVGGSLSAGADDDSATATATFVKSYSERGIELLADILQNPKFAQEEIDRRMRQSLSGLSVNYSDPEYLLPVTAGRAVLRTHPYAYPGDGTPQSLRNLKRDDFVDFHKKYYAPKRSWLAVSGDITPEEAFRLAEKYFGAWKNEGIPDTKTPPPPTDEARVVVVDTPEAVQTQISIAQMGVQRNSPDYLALQVANQIFGGSFNSRLNMKLRANEGLTYGANSRLQGLRQAGLFTLSTFTRTEKTGQAVKMMMDLLKEFYENPSTPQELQESQAFMAGSFALSNETSAAVANRILATAVFGLPDNYWTNYRDNVLSLTQAKVADAVKRTIKPGKFTITAVGKGNEFIKELEPFGPVKVIPVADLDLTAPDMVKAKAATVGGAAGAAKAKALIDAAVKAQGGKEKILAVKDMTSKGKMAIIMPQGRMDAEAEELILFPDKYKTTMTLPMGKITQVTDGTVAWMSQGDSVRDLPPGLGAELVKGVQTAAAVGLLAAASDGSAQVALLGDNAVQWKKGDFEVKITFDPQTGRVATTTFRGMGMGGPAETETTYGDYRDVGGVWLPFSETIAQNGQKVGERTMSERKVNAGISPDSFKKP